jgi:hypothetical protein
VYKNSKHWCNEKGPSSKTKIVLPNNSENLTQPLNAYDFWMISLFLFYTKSAKSATADGQHIQSQLTKKCGKF